ncbi:MAG: threonine synthase [Spirochaetes bacterium]|nr:threonine synthase [Spirochaetota bacterium]
MKTQYVCSECGKTFEITPDLMVCPVCSALQEPDKPLRGILEVRFKGQISRDFEITDFLPVEREFFPPIPVGNTPLWQPEKLRNKFGMKNLYIKDDAVNPTGSFKDRASYLVAAFAQKHNIRDIVLASTGNAGSSMAGVGAAAGLNIILFLPKAAPVAKMVQSLQYGATVHRVDGNYDLACQKAMEYVKSHPGVMSRSTAYNPMTLEGKKTVSLEIFQQLAYQQPDYVFVSAGDGCIVGGVLKGFQDLQDAGLIKKMPTVYAVQSDNSSAIYRAVNNNGEFTVPVSATTIADSISVDVPANGYYVVKKLKQHQGKCITVTDDQIVEAQKELSSTAGLFAEPAAATSYAGFKKASSELPKDASVVLLVTGSGLKDVNTAMKGIVVPD